MKQQIEYLLLKLLISVFRILPYPLALRLGASLGGGFHRLDRRHRLIALDNLRAAFKEEKTEAELEAIALGVYQNLGRSAVEVMRLSHQTPAEIMAMTEIEGLEHYQAAKAENKGVILLGAHFGNWEWIPTALGIAGAPMHIIVRPIDNPFIDRMIHALRERHGNTVLNKRTDTPEVIRLLRKGEAIGFLLDQNVGREKAIFVDYFGRPAGTNKALATIALRTGAPVVPMFVIRQKYGHKIVIEKPMDLPRSGVLKDDLVEITRLFTNKIESYVRQYPEQWLWLHRRWKTRPPEEDGVDG